MVTITIRHLDRQMKQRLRVRAAKNNRSMVEEVRDILRRELREPTPDENLAIRIQARVEEFGGFDLVIAPREPIRDIGLFKDLDQDLPKRP